MIRLLLQEEYDPKKMDFRRLRRQDLDGQLRTEQEAVSVLLYVGLCVCCFSSCLCYKLVLAMCL